MKKLLFIFLFIASYQLSFAQNKGEGSVNLSDTTIVEASCGQCQFGLPGKGCNLAVRINGVAYFVEGSHIDGHGDAHAEDGFCNAVRKAKVIGEVKENKFHASYFHLLTKSADKISTKKRKK